MGLFGGSSQSTSSVVSSIDFSPIIQFGEDQTSTQDKVNRQDATTSPKLDDSLGLSASVGVAGGTGGPAQTSRYQEEDAQPKEAGVLRNIGTDDNKKLLYIIGGVGAIGAIYLLINKKSKKKK
ncbi:hypothetical protein AMRN_1420 [Malaciobacter marinus]|uniref:Uncharacterized protein n=1 Tax=Malaciobacter marinus TaxID=505249 RepID=A0A347TKM8_9BACT|nr:hypothetical protein [Malaciobacter marinus]AXX87156.1 hypothetical protein AMRN_1420 [Malaciobacter marinus]PHO14819.1 hypothetical protein CPH92_09540 [Malaciobacter marinus]